MDKILTIRKTLGDFEKFHPNLGSKCTNDFKHFDLVSDEDVLRVIKNSESTTCPTDPMTSKLILLVKHFLRCYCPINTSIFNKSLTFGVYANDY